MIVQSPKHIVSELFRENKTQILFTVILAPWCNVPLRNSSLSQSSMYLSMGEMCSNSLLAGNLEPSRVSWWIWDRTWSCSWADLQSFELNALSSTTSSKHCQVQRPLVEHNLLLREPEVNSVMLPKIQTDYLPESLHEWLLTRFLHVYNPWKPIRVSVVISRTIPWITNASLMVLWFRYRCYTTTCFVEVVFIDQANGMPYHGSMSNRSG